MPTDRFDIDALEREVEARNQHARTHYDGCYLSSNHRDCAITLLIQRVRELEDASRLCEGVSDAD